MTPEERRQYIARLVDQAPPLTEAQRARLSALLRPAVRRAETPDQPKTAARKKAKAA